MSVAVPNLANVQGDILFGLPKQSQKFIFFKINEVDGFRTNFANLVPLINTADQTKGTISAVKTKKKLKNLAVNAGDGETVHTAEVADVITVDGVNIAFSHKGLETLALTDLDKLGDAEFATGQKNDSIQLGDAGPKTSPPQPKWDPQFLQEIHGVLLVTGNNQTTLDKKVNDVQTILSTSIEQVHSLQGDVRPGSEAGHEHFGYQDGVSQPAVKGIDNNPFPGQLQADPGVILLNRTGDSVRSRPSWALDGSFMVFRKLNQLVPEFNKFLLDTAGGNQTGADLLGARFVGRWKSGAPVALAPTADDPDLGADPQRNNNFAFASADQTKCPFHAHIRKTAPRNTAAGTSHFILRRGIPFGPEVSNDEQETTTQDRGLLFVSYQSSIANGFKFLQKTWANNAGFPQANVGFDPIIGQTIGEGPRNVTGAFADSLTTSTVLIKEWVNAKGGEYFFSPSIPTLRDIIAKKPASSRM